VVVALIVPLVRSYTQTEASSRPLCPSSSATGVVQAYYRALNQHRAAAAKACLTRYYLTQVLHVVDPDWVNVISARVVKLTARKVSASVLPPNISPSPYRAIQVDAEVVVPYRRIGSSPDGLNTWFIYAIKQQARAPWRIADIGSGP
jgi:hypothetical protein